MQSSPSFDVVIAVVERAWQTVAKISAQQDSLIISNTISSTILQAVPGLCARFGHAADLRGVDAPMLAGPM